MPTNCTVSICSMVLSCGAGPAVKGHEKIFAEVLNAAAGSAGHGIHLSLEIGGAIVLAAALVALVAARRRTSLA